MKTLYDFYETLTPGDVITSVGVKGVNKKDEVQLTNNRYHHEGWNKYARVTSVESDGDVGNVDVKWEGIDESISDCERHVASRSAPEPITVRKTTKTEHRAFVEEYLKTRLEIVDHKQEEIVHTRKTLAKERRKLAAIASKENIDTSKLLNKRKK